MNAFQTLYCQQSAEGWRRAVSHMRANPATQAIQHAAARADVISLIQGQGDDPTPDFIRHAAAEALAEGDTFYPPLLGLPALRQEISDYYARILNAAVAPESVFVTPSGSAAITAAFAFLLNPGDEVITISPMWNNLTMGIDLCQASKRDVMLQPCAKRGWTLDLDRFFDSVTDNTRAMLIVTPGNPSGWVASDAEISAILDFARQKGIWIIADEIYNRIVSPGLKRSPSFLDKAEPHDRLFVVNSFSKTYAMTGWRLGWLIGPEGVEDSARKILAALFFGTAAFSQKAGITALRDGEAYIAARQHAWDANRTLMRNALSQMDHVDFIVPEAGFFALTRLPEFYTDCVALTIDLIEKAGVGLSPGCGFGDITAGYVRWCMAGGQDRLAQALARFEKFTRQLS